MIGVDNTELHYCRADVRAEEGNPVAQLEPLGWTCIGPPCRRKAVDRGAREHISRTLITRDPNVGVSDVCSDVDGTLGWLKRASSTFQEVDFDGS